MARKLDSVTVTLAKVVQRQRELAEGRPVIVCPDRDPPPIPPTEEELRAAGYPSTFSKPVLPSPGEDASHRTAESGAVLQPAAFARARMAATTRLRELLAHRRFR